MGAAQQSFLAGAAPYLANAVKYNGTTDYLEKLADFSGNVDAFTGIFSTWVRLDGGDGVEVRLLNAGGNSPKFARLTNNRFNASFDLTNFFAFNFNSTGTYTTSATWRHLLMAWNTNFAAGLKITQLYVNDVNDLGSISDAAAAATVDYTKTSWGVSGRPSAHDLTLNGALAETYFAPNQFLDLDVTANRRKFISSLGKPAYLGADGSLPTGTQPILYLRNPAASVNVNSGTGGNFTIGGAPSVASTSPSD